MSLQGKRVVVLGGTAGIGLATAQAAAAAGAQVTVASSNAARGEAARRALPAPADAPAVARTVDLSDEQAIATLFETLEPFDHLVYTAGEALQLSLLRDADLATARRFWNVRYWGAYAAVKHGHSRLRAGGSVVLTGGAASVRPGASWSRGASICGAMESLTRALAVELAPIRVNLVRPGIVRTDLWANLPAGDREALYAEYGRKLLVGRIGEASDIAEAYLYFMRNGYSTGQIVTIDGGGVLV